MEKALCPFFFAFRRCVLCLLLAGAAENRSIIGAVTVTVTVTETVRENGTVTVTVGPYIHMRVPSGKDEVIGSVTAKPQNHNRNRKRNRDGNHKSNSGPYLQNSNSGPYLQAMRRSPARARATAATSAGAARGAPAQIAPPHLLHPVMRPARFPPVRVTDVTVFIKCSFHAQNCHPEAVDSSHQKLLTQVWMV